MTIVNEILDFLIKLVPLVGIVIAWKGLSTWRRQIKGTDKYKVASELLLEVYKVREGIGVVRTSLVQFSPVDDKNASKEMNEFLGYVETMERRWKQVTEPVIQLSLLALKAEVHLGKDIKSAVDELMRMVVELQVTYEQYIDVRRPDSGFTAADFDKEARKVLWSKPTGDTFKEGLLASVEKIEGLASKYL
jgi:hypothetical protein